MNKLPEKYYWTSYVPDSAFFMEQTVKEKLGNEFAKLKEEYLKGIPIPN